MTVPIERTVDPNVVNGILNHPSVRPWIADTAAGAIDVTTQLAHPNVLALRGEHGVFVVFGYDTGIYECHTAILPSGRGEWARAFARAGLRYMFTRTDCVDLLTRVPEPHGAARQFALSAGFIAESVTLPETKFQDGTVAVEIYSMSVRDWSLTALDLEQQGEQFHEWLNRQVGVTGGQPHPNDPAHNRTVGIALAMIRGGQVTKGVIWYNRWAIAARHKLIQLASIDPVTIRFDAGLLELCADGTIIYAVAN